MTTFTINGTPYTVDLTKMPPDITLNTFIREHAQLTATKFMCLEGGCGVCVCVVTEKHPVSGENVTKAVNSCLKLLNTCTDVEITTVEGLGDKRSGYHPIQKRLAKMNGTQCGFCSPGFVMNMYGLLTSKANKVSMNEVENCFGGNICRCTGYRPILDAMKSFAVDSNIAIPDECQDIEDLQPKNCSKMCKGQEDACCLGKSLTYADGTQWHWPKTMSQLFEVLGTIENEQQYMLVAGNTAHGVYRRSPDIEHFIDVNALSDLKTQVLTPQLLTLGANLSLSEAMSVFEQATTQTGFEYCSQLWQHFDLIANVPVRNAGTLAGNISIKKLHPDFPSDVFITFEALDVQVVVKNSIEEEQKMDISAYLEDKRPKLVLTAFLLKPLPKDSYIFNSYKIMPRAQNAHAFVNAAFLMEINSSTYKISNARLCFGGITPEFVHATPIENQLINQNVYDKNVMATVFTHLSELIKPDEVLPNTSPVFRNMLACGLFYKFILSTAPQSEVNESYKSGATLLSRPLSCGSQTFTTVEKNYPVTEAVHKVEGMIQCSGEATYMNDVLTTANAVHCAFVGATKVGATIEQIDASAALKMPGVLAFYTASDIPGQNSFTDASLDYELDEIFANTTVKYFNQPIGVMVALSPDQANRASTKVNVVYSSTEEKVMPTLNDVLNANAEGRIIQMTEPQTDAFKCNEAADVVESGIFEIGPQYHFTMEPQTAIVIPLDDGLVVYSATQWMDHTQAVIAKALKINAANVQLQVRRLGGGYGSKISRGNLVACAAALAAYKLNRPARFVQTIESMMNVNGKRWACRSDYKFTVKADGKVLNLINTFYQDAGCNKNENPVLFHSTLMAKNCYALTKENYKLTGNAVLTDAPSSTWCRAPGSVEAVAMIENIVEHIAFAVNKDPADVRLVNMAKGHKLGTLLPQFLASRDYKERRKAIDDFNSQNRWRKRGIGLALTDYPMYLFGQFPATVAIYHVDGTVVITHGGIEMGQGMNTKISQVAAYTLGIDLSLIKIESSNTINGANSMVTGGSVGSECVCFAVRKACQTLNTRLSPIKKALEKNASWQQVVQAAYEKMINMIASEQYKEGDMQNYNVCGLALTEIELDVLTGCNQIKRVDILEDAGESISPYIDVGQIEGAFVMCLGYWLTEQLVYNRESGQLMTDRTWTYKPPGAKDIPIDFRIELVQNTAPSSAGFMRSKATGEPPCCLAVSVIFALQHALQSARKDAGLPRKWLELEAPTTPETLLLNSGNEVNSYILK